MELELWCDGCVEVTVFVAPGCDEHASVEDCPERCCTGCGRAVWLASCWETSRPASRSAPSAAGRPAA